MRAGGFDFSEPESENVMNTSSRGCAHAPISSILPPMDLPSRARSPYCRRLECASQTIWGWGGGLGEGGDAWTGGGVAEGGGGAGR